MSFSEALESLANQLGIKMAARSGGKRMPILDALSKLADYYQGNLKKSDAARAYLTRRGIKRHNDRSVQARLQRQSATTGRISQKASESLLICSSA